MNPEKMFCYQGRHSTNVHIYIFNAPCLGSCLLTFWNETIIFSFHYGSLSALNGANHFYCLKCDTSNGPNRFHIDHLCVGCLFTFCLSSVLILGNIIHHCFVNWVMLVYQESILNICYFFLIIMALTVYCYIPKFSRSQCLTC